jgi:PAS domain S-box-containing protein
MISSLDGTILQCNRTLERILGFAQGELQGQPSSRVIHPDDGAMQKDLVRRILAGAPTTGISAQRRYVRKDGRTVWGMLTVTVVGDASGNPQYALGVIEDITERHLAEAERGQLLHELQLALSNVKTLSGLVPICSCCKKIRDDRGYWTQVERYLAQHTGAQFSHGICPDCMKELYPEYTEGNGMEHLAAGGGALTPEFVKARELHG